MRLGCQRGTLPHEEPPKPPRHTQHLHLQALKLNGKRSVAKAASANPMAQAEGRAWGLDLCSVTMRDSSLRGLNPWGQRTPGKSISVPPKATLWFQETSDKK